jgi:hypothetical protein
LALPKERVFKALLKDMVLEALDKQLMVNTIE